MTYMVDNPMMQLVNNHEAIKMVSKMQLFLGNSKEYPQHMFSEINKKISIILHPKTCNMKLYDSLWIVYSRFSYDAAS